MTGSIARLRTVLVAIAALVFLVVLTRILQTDVYLRWGDAAAARRPGFVGAELLGRAPGVVRRAGQNYDRTVAAAWAACGIAMVGHALACVARGEPVVTQRSSGVLATGAFLLAITATWTIATLG